MQYILSEEEMEIYKRCKRAVEQDYNYYTGDNCKTDMNGSFTLERTKWALGKRDTFPNTVN